jgi:hypothetical protein
VEIEQQPCHICDRGPILVAVALVPKAR